jgi:hypothetical protein
VKDLDLCNPLKKIKGDRFFDTGQKIKGKMLHKGFMTSTTKSDRSIPDFLLTKLIKNRTHTILDFGLGITFSVWIL